MNKLSVNWELAPEGATHYMPENDDFYASWIKDNDSCFEVWCDDRRKWLPDDDLYDYEHTFVEKRSKTVFHEVEKLKQQNKELVKALETTLSHCILWQGEPDEFSCGVHSAVVKIARKALKNSENIE